MLLSEYFCGTIKPVYAGWYDCESWNLFGKVKRWYWDGERWNTYGSITGIFGAVCAPRCWRGLSKPC